MVGLLASEVSEKREKRLDSENPGIDMSVLLREQTVLQGELNGTLWLLMFLGNGLEKLARNGEA
jgi:hypothetical protein